MKFWKFWILINNNNIKFHKNINLPHRHFLSYLIHLFSKYCRRLLIIQLIPLWFKNNFKRIKYVFRRKTKSWAFDRFRLFCETYICFCNIIPTYRRRLKNYYGTWSKINFVLKLMYLNCISNVERRYATVAYVCINV